MHNDSNLTLKQIEELENKYLMKYWYFLKYAEDDIIAGFNSKNDIFEDWKGLYGSNDGGMEKLLANRILLQLVQICFLKLKMHIFI